MSAHEASSPRSVPARPKPAVAALLSSASPRYWTCVVLLLLSAIGMKAAQGFGLAFRKEAIPLKKPLHLIDISSMGPRYRLSPLTHRLEPLTEDLIASLGTKEYAQLLIEDTTRAPADRTYRARVFISYYTGQPDMVPHVPDECYLAGGYDKARERTVRLTIPGVGAPDDQVAVRVLAFRARKLGLFDAVNDQQVSVSYFFHVNGGYATTRNGVRLSMSNLFLRHAYYSKIELTFANERGVGASPEEAADALGPLLAGLLPVLVREHFDLSSFDAGAPAGGPGFRNER